MRNIPSFMSFVALLMQDFLPTSKYKLFSGRPHNWAVVMCKGLQTLRGTRVRVRRVGVEVRIF